MPLGHRGRGRHRPEFIALVDAGTFRSSLAPSPCQIGERGPRARSCLTARARTHSRRRQVGTTHSSTTWGAAALLCPLPAVAEHAGASHDGSDARDGDPARSIEPSSPAPTCTTSSITLDEDLLDAADRSRAEGRPLVDVNSAAAPVDLRWRARQRHDSAQWGGRPQGNRSVTSSSSWLRPGESLSRVD